MLDLTFSHLFGFLLLKKVVKSFWLISYKSCVFWRRIQRHRNFKNRIKIEGIRNYQTILYGMDHVIIRTNSTDEDFNAKEAHAHVHERRTKGYLVIRVPKSCWPLCTKFNKDTWSCDICGKEFSVFIKDRQGWSCHTCPKELLASMYQIQQGHLIVWYLWKRVFGVHKWQTRMSLSHMSQRVVGVYRIQHGCLIVWYVWKQRSKETKCAKANDSLLQYSHPTKNQELLVQNGKVYCLKPKSYEFQEFLATNFTSESLCALQIKRQLPWWESKELCK